jgi:hypothetical protein
MLLAKKGGRDETAADLKELDLFVEAIAKKLGLATDKVADCVVFDADISRICSNKPSNSRFASRDSVHFQGTLAELSRPIDELHNGKWKGLFPFYYYEYIDPDDPTAPPWPGWAYLVNSQLHNDVDTDGCPNDNWWRLFDEDFNFAPRYDFTPGNGNPCIGEDNQLECAKKRCPIEIDDMNLRLVLKYDEGTPIHIVELYCYRDGLNAYCEKTCDSLDPELPCPE